MVTESVSSDAVQAGQATFTPELLGVYDWIILGLFNPLMWRCPTSRMVDLYDRHVSANHLDVGVGTGYFLDHCRFPTDRPSITLLDLNPNALQHAARRISRYAPRVHRANVLEPIDLEANSFGSIGMNYVLHCLPGNMATKAVAFRHLVPLLRNGGVLFGATVLYRGVKQTRLSRHWIHRINKRRIFCNLDDDLEGLHRALGEYFRDHNVEVVGSVAMFVGSVSSVQSLH